MASRRYSVFLFEDEPTVDVDVEPRKSKIEYLKEVNESNEDYDDEGEESDLIKKRESSLIHRVDSMDLTHAEELTPDNIYRAKPNRTNSILAKISYLFLFLAMLAIASGGAAFLKYPEDVKERPLLASQWRSQGLCYCLIPLAIIQLIRLPKESKEKAKSLRAWIYVLIAAVGVTMWTGTWAVALRYTSLTRAYLLNNSQPILMVTWNKITGKDVSAAQICGVILGMFGLILTSLNELIQEGLAGLDLKSLMGDGIAFAGAFFACLYIHYGGAARLKVPSFIFLAPVMILSTGLFTIGTIFIEGSSPMDLIRWTDMDNLPILAWSTLIVGMIGYLLISVVMEYVPSLMISVVLLFEPIAASVMGILVKVETPPSFLTWLGAGLITFGILVVTMGYNQETKKFFTKLLDRIRGKPKKARYSKLDASTDYSLGHVN